MSRLTIIRVWAPPLLALALAAGAYGWFARLMTYPAGVVPGVWNIVLDVACSPQFITYIGFPLWIVATFVACGKATSPTRRLRLGSDWRAISAAAGQLGRVLVAGVLAVCAGALVAGIGLPVLAVPTPNTAAGRYFAIGVPPAAALLVQVLLSAAMLMAMGILLVALHVRCASWPLVVSLAGVLFAWVAASANGLVLGWPSLISSIDAAVVLRGVFPVAVSCLVVAALATAGVVATRDRAR